MVKKIFNLLKKVIVASLLLYTYNQLAVSFNGIIPINIFTIIFVAILGMPAMIGLVIFNFLFF